jgi:hypothetical protein
LLWYTSSNQMTTRQVFWFMPWKYSYQTKSHDGDYDVLTVCVENPIVPRTLANKVVGENQTLTDEIANKINGFLFVKAGVLVEPDEILPSVISLADLPEICERIVSCPSNNVRKCFSRKYRVSAIAKAYLQTIGRGVWLTRFQCYFVLNWLAADGFLACPSPSGSYSTLVTFYGIIGYLLGDKDWLDTYLESRTAVFASEDNPAFHTHMIDDHERTWIIGNRSELPARERFLSPYPSTYDDSDSDSDSDDDY